jgi:hypothetical protein
MPTLRKLATAIVVALVALGVSLQLATAAGQAPEQKAAKKVEKTEKNAIAEALSTRVNDLIQGYFLPTAPPPPAAPLPAAIVKRGVPAIPAPPGPPADDDPSLEPMALRIAAQIQPRLRAELRLMATITRPTPDQLQGVNLDATQAMLETARKIARIQRDMQQGGWRGETMPDAGQALLTAIDNGMKTRLFTPEQLARYHLEDDRRDQENRETVILNLIAQLDQLLFLTKDQRDQLFAAMTKEANASVFPSLETMKTYSQYYLAIPDHLIIPILGEQQRRTWRGTTKINGGQLVNAFQFNANVVNREPVPPGEESLALLPPEPPGGAAQAPGMVVVDGIRPGMQPVIVGTAVKAAAAVAVPVAKPADASRPAPDLEKKTTTTKRGQP